jgi:Tol biopolymer transport system component/DNA-binding SARP family transcriptional activator
VIRLRVLGPIELHDSDGRELSAILAQPKRLALLIYLAVGARGFHRRDTLLALFWPELDELHGRQALNQAIRFLRKELGGSSRSAVTSRGTEELGIDTASLWCDAAALRDEIVATRYREALELYRGDFLQGFFADSGAEFEQWLDAERARLRAAAAKAARAVAEARETDQDFTTAVAAARRAVELSDADERVVRELLLLLDRLGDRAGALHAYETFARRLADQFDATPAPETLAVMERIRARVAIAGEFATHGGAPAREPAPGAPSPPATGVSPPTSGSDSAPSEWRLGRKLPVPTRAVAVSVGAFAVSAAALALLTGRGAPGSFVVQTTRLVSASPELEVDPAISPDGKLVAYASGRRSEMRIFVRQLGGGAAVLLSGALAGDHRWPRWSPDGTQILFVVKRDTAAGGGDAYFVPYVGGTPRLLIEARGEGVITPSWSAEGKHLLYSDGRQILLQALDGRAPTRVAEGIGLHSPAMSPDGRRVAYVSGNTLGLKGFNVASSSVWITSVPGQRPTRITDSTYENSTPAWSADGRSLLFISDIAGERDIYQQLLSRNGAPLGSPLRRTTGLGASALSLSENGARAVYSVRRLRSQVWLAPISHVGTTPMSTLRQVTSETEAIEGLDVSRDGKWLVYDSNRSGNQDIYKVLIDGGEPIQLTHDPAPDLHPQWSPNGREIAYYSIRTGNRDIRVMSSEGHRDQAVTRHPTEESNPAWSPDGNTLAFSSGRPGFTNIFLVPRDARGDWASRRQLTHERLAGLPINVGVKWSPDGKWISCVARRGESLELIAPPADSQRTLTTARELGGLIRYAVWAQDSGIVYVHTSSGPTSVSFWAVSLSQGSPRLLLKFDDSARFVRRREFATDGRRLFFSVAADESDIWVMELTR